MIPCWKLYRQIESFLLMENKNLLTLYHFCAKKSTKKNATKNPLSQSQLQINLRNIRLFCEIALERFLPLF